MTVNREDFIKAWQMSNSIDEVCHKTQLSYNTVRVKANRLRKIGIPLKHIRRYNIDELIKLARTMEAK